MSYGSDLEGQAANVDVRAQTSAKPYRAECRNAYWVAVDTRTDRHVSYPTASKRQCADEVATLNRAYAEAVAADEPEGVLPRALSGAAQ